MLKQTFFEGAWRSPEEVENLKRQKAADGNKIILPKDAPRGRFIEGKGFISFEQRAKELEEKKGSGKLSSKEEEELDELTRKIGN